MMVDFDDDNIAICFQSGNVGSEYFLFFSRFDSSNHSISRRLIPFLLFFISHTHHHSF